MQYRTLGRTGVEVSEIVLGAWQFGKGAWADIEDDESYRTIRAAIDAGINLIDTAVGYGEGYSEEVVGRAVREHGGGAMLASKVMGGPEAIKSGIDECLRRMGIECIDLYQLHYPARGISIADQVGAMAEIQQAGKIRWIGVSNFSLEEHREALATARIETSQPPYNVFWRQYEEDAIPFCAENGIAVIPYSPLAQGLLTGRFRSKADVPADIRSRNKLLSPEILERCLPVIDRLAEIAKGHGKTLTQAAIAWTLQAPGITAPIVGARRPSQVAENIGGVGWRLTDNEWQEISEAGGKVNGLLDFSSNMWGWVPG
jgi:myo-inositol catabolism protein IolS